MKQLILIGTMIVLSLILIANCYAEKTLIRSFVNGNPSDKKVFRLYVEYTGQIRNPKIVGTANATLSIENKKRRRVDIQFQAPFPSGASIGIAITSDRKKLAVKRFWWADEQNHSIPRTIISGRRRYTITQYRGYMRGDETSWPKASLDPYAIINKRHHYGGKDRLSQTVSINMNIRRFIDRAPADLDKTKLLALVEAVVKQWVDATHAKTSANVPKAGVGPIPANHGLGLGPAVMAPGPSHKGSAGAKYRSLTTREAEAARLKYPMGLNINLITDPKDTGRIDILANWRNRMPAGALGWGPSYAKIRRQKDKTTEGYVYIKKSLRSGKKWHIGTDTNNDSYITNGDTDVVPAKSYDLCSVFLHELGHVLCFYHSGRNLFMEAPEFAVVNPTDLGLPQPIAVPACYPYTTGDSDSETAETDYLFFAAELPDGFGGLDLYQALTTENGIEIVNLGQSVNSIHDDTDPFVASDGLVLLFSSNRPGGQGGFDLYEARHDPDTEQWMDVMALDESVNSDKDDRNPGLRADMGTLYFSSNRAGGEGGFDIWSSEFVATQGYTPPTNMGDQINGPTDEAGVTVAGLANFIIFASNRNGGEGGSDLWMSEFDEEMDEGYLPPRNLGPQINSPADEIAPALSYDHEYLSFGSDRESDPGAFVLYHAVSGTQPQP